MKTTFERDFAYEEVHSTIYNPYFNIWEDKDGFYCVCKFDYAENQDKHFKTLKQCLAHIKRMLNKFAKEHRLLSWNISDLIVDIPNYKEDFGNGLETYHGLVYARTCDDAPEYMRMGELMDEYMAVTQGEEE